MKRWSNKLVRKIRRGGGTRPLLLDIDGEKFFERTRTRERERRERRKTKGKGNEGKKKVTVPGGATQHGLSMTGENATSLANRRQKGLHPLGTRRNLQQKNNSCWRCEFPLVRHQLSAIGGPLPDGQGDPVGVVQWLSARLG